MADDIIALDDGYANVKRNGIDPFISFIETGEREFFKARDFVKLYDLIFKMYAAAHGHTSPPTCLLPLCLRSLDGALTSSVYPRVCVPVHRCIQRDPYNWSTQHLHSLRDTPDCIFLPAHFLPLSLLFSLFASCRSEAMYEKYTQSILDYLISLVVPALTKAKQDGYESGFLREWKQRWNNHKLIVTGLSKLFMYLDRFYTPVSAAFSTAAPPARHYCADGRAH